MREMMLEPISDDDLRTVRGAGTIEETLLLVNAAIESLSVAKVAFLDQILP